VETFPLLDTVDYESVAYSPFSDLGFEGLETPEPSSPGVFRVRLDDALAFEAPSPPLSRRDARGPAYKTDPSTRVEETAQN